MNRNFASAGLFGYLSARIARASRQLPLFPKAIALVWTSAPAWTMGWIAILIARGLLPVALVYLTRPLVNSVLTAMRTGGGYRQAAVYAALMAGVLLATEALNSLQSWVSAAQSELVRNHIGALVQEKSAAADLGFYETPDFYDHLHRARFEAAHVPLALIGSLGGLAQNGITLLAMAGVLLTFGAWLPIALVLSTLPAFCVVLRYAAIQYGWSVKTTPDERRAGYYDHVLSSRDYAPELRLFALAPHFRDCFDALRLRIAGEKIGLARNQAVAEFAAGAAALAISALSLLWMAQRAVRGQASAGDLALFYQAFQQGSGLTRVLLANIGQIYRNSLYLEGLFEFLDLKPLVTSALKPLSLPEARLGIRFKDVRFRYPGSERLALDGFSLDVPAGKIIAVVGENGAGKSTLVKLLCRFYDPESGSVALDGCDLRSLDLAELRSRIAVLFQEPARYQATVSENIAPGRAAAVSLVDSAAREAGADHVIAKLPLGSGHMLGRWFSDGVDLSVGEWQRIALARAFFRDAPILVLDEPTSAMDPWAESDWLDRFRKLAEGRTVLVITHRFTTARTADTIAVIVAGRIIEQGTHRELLARGGRYAAGWDSQLMPQ